MHTGLPNGEEISDEDEDKDIVALGACKVRKATHQWELEQHLCNKIPVQIWIG